MLTVKSAYLICSALDRITDSAYLPHLNLFSPNRNFNGVDS